jgi:type II secretory pathway predicted ATPase ExeA/LysM repeat protein
MYCDFYQLSERPFNVTPDPKFLYLNARYREAIASLNYGITQRKGFITLIGEAGTGKTTLLNKLLEDLDAKTKSVFIFNTHVTFEEILEYIFAEFDLPVHNGKKLYMLQRLNSFLLEELRGGGNVALLIDEAQDLEFSVLEDLRLLSNLETAKEKILQIVLSGQPELGTKLSNPLLRQLRQRIGINCRLLPLSRDEISEYIQYRLQAAGCHDLKLFSREAEDQVYHFSRGIPRLVNVVCDNALVIGYALSKKRIGADVIAEAAADLLSIEPPAEEVVEQPAIALAPAAPTTYRGWLGRFGVIALMAVALMLGLFAIGRTILQTRAGKPDGEPTAGPRRLALIRPGSQQQPAGVDVPTIADAHPAEESAIHKPVAPDTAHLGEQGAARGAGAGGSHRDTVAASAPSTASFPGAAGRVVPVAGPNVEHSAEPPHPLPADVVKAPDGSRPAMALEPKPGTDTTTGSVGNNRSAQVAALEHEDGTPHAAAEDYTARSAVRAGAKSAPRLDGAPCSTVVVQPGDSMSSIAMRKYGQASPTILDLLKLANPDLEDLDVIAVGQSIRVPELGEGFPILIDGAGRYSLLVYTTPHRNRANALQVALRNHGFGAQVSSGNVGGAGRSMFRVVVSGFSGHDDGAAVGRKLQQLFREDTRMAQFGQ